ncbi:MAG: glycosyltransferase [Candidatus Micrarchaeia archaeon]
MICGIYTGKHPVHEVLFESVCDKTIQFRREFLPLWVLKQIMYCPKADKYITENNFYAPIARKIRDRHVSIINLLSSPYILKYSAFFKPFVNYIDKQICLGNLSKDLFLAIYPNYKNDVNVIYPFVLEEDLKLIKETKKETKQHTSSKKSNVFIITTIANGDYKIKGLDLLEQAISTLKIPLEVKIVGNTNFIPKDSRIKLLGKLDKRTLYGIVANSTLYVQSSRLDIFPVSVLEALHLGVPVLVSNMVGCKEYLYEESVFRTEDVFDLREKLLANLSCSTCHVKKKLPSQKVELMKFYEMINHA